MAKIDINHPEAHEKLTAKLFWKLTSERGYVDAGNVLDYVDATNRSLVTRSRSQQGARHVNDEQTDVNHEAYTFKLDERVPEQERLIKLARNMDDQQQNSTEAASATISNIALDRWFDIGAWNIANVMVAGNVAGVLDEGTDYELDKENGRIMAFSGGSAASGETLHLTFDQPGFALEKRRTQQDPLFYCDLIIEEHNQYHRMWLRRKVFRGYINLTEFPSHTGEFATYRAKVTPAEPVTVLKRPEGQTLPSHVEGGVAGDLSSNSSSSSTYSSSSSSSTKQSYTSSYSSLSLSSRSSLSSYSSSSSSPSSTSSQSTSSSSPVDDGSMSHSSASSKSSLSSNSSSTVASFTSSSNSSSSTVASYTSSYSSESSSSGHFPNTSSQSEGSF